MQQCPFPLHVGLTCQAQLNSSARSKQLPSPRQLVAVTTTKGSLDGVVYPADNRRRRRKGERYDIPRGCDETVDVQQMRAACRAWCGNRLGSQAFSLRCCFFFGRTLASYSQRHALESCYTLSGARNEVHIYSEKTRRLRRSCDFLSRSKASCSLRTNKMGPHRGKMSGCPSNH